MRIFKIGTVEFETAVKALARRGESDLASVEPDVRAILEGVQRDGDQALRRFVQRFEKRELDQTLLDPAQWHTQTQQVPVTLRKHLEHAADRIRKYHAHQVESGYAFESDGVRLEHRLRPLDSVGVYAPGGKARYPSTVLMCAIPAQVAGVKRIVLASPDPTPEILLAAQLSGVTEVLNCGGAQAIAALSYGTETVNPVAKIVGPGNLYVACAKKLVFGTVGIDSVAGPSEILVVADAQANPSVVAADLLSQAEHDESAYPLLICVGSQLHDAILSELLRQLQALPRKAIAEVSVRERGACFVVETREQAAELASQLASEHLALHVSEPASLAEQIPCAGAIFVGAFTPETAGDYAAGPSHVLPTGGSARFSSPLGVYDFVVRTSLITYSAEALRSQRALLTDLARLEGLEAHARAVEVRFDKED